MDIQYINAEAVKRVCRVFRPTQQFWGCELIADWSVPAAVSTLKPYADPVMCWGFRFFPESPPVEIDPDTGMPYGLSDLIDMGTYD